MKFKLRSWWWKRHPKAYLRHIEKRMGTKYTKHQKETFMELTEIAERKKLKQHQEEVKPKMKEVIEDTCPEFKDRFEVEFK
jgi:hypothetical protein